MEKTAEELAAEAAAAAEAEAAAAASAAAAEDEDEPEGADQLGDAGKKALDALKEKRRKTAAERDAERGMREQYESILRGLGVDPAALMKKASEQSSGDVEAIRREANSKANTRIVRSEIRAAAAGKLADPKDALVHLDVSKFEVNDDGEVDSDEIADAITELLKDKPYLAAATAKRFQGTGDGGAARKAGGVKQVTEAELKTMTPDQIVKAQNEGRLSDLLSAG